MTNNPNIFHRAVDTVRAAPLGFSLALVGLAPGAIALVENGPQMSDIAVGALGAGFVTTGVGLVVLQLQLKKRLEKAIDRTGYSDNIMSLTTPTWCNRQTARVVCANAGYLAEYKELCERTKDENQLTWFPNF